MKYEMDIRNTEALKIAKEVADEISICDLDELCELDDYQDGKEGSVVLTAGYDGDGIPQYALGHRDYVGTWLNADITWSEAKSMEHDQLIATLTPLVEAGLDADAETAAV